ncbi:MAG: hypothetical protein BJ554DRAFT_5743 [Olpidium bornovanus]|uniref:Cilia- and flagella-associated protein 263 n=1 Tax=Olpidium bornovanus TaxID=278681 RepID=A0A8H7ZYV4_9FUNG|nr:MAG: hypothetical protein BJ554DRAFT_5743 [Olpidium bornovanus]
MAERVVRYYEDTIRAKVSSQTLDTDVRRLNADTDVFRIKDATVEKIRLKNTALKVHKNKLALQLKQKEEMGEVLHAIDFDQLTIENQNYQMKIEERNKELLKLKLTAANTVQILNHYKKRLPLLTAESEKLKSDIAARRQLLVKLGEESVVARTERAIAAEANRRVKERIGEFRVPRVMDYVVQKAKREEAFRRLASWERKVEIAEMALARARRTWKQISRECNMQLAVAAAIASPPHRLGPLHGRASDNLPEARRTVSFAPAVSRHVHTSPAQDTAPLGLEAVF